jgi:hypothetical protein
MGESLKQLMRAMRFERDAFVWMDFNDRATGDALIFVAVTRFLILLGLGWSLFGIVSSLSALEVLFSSLFNALVFWLAYAGLAWAIAKFFFQGEGNYATTLRIVGFAYPTLLLVLFTRYIVSSPILAILLGGIWFLAIVAHGLRYSAGLSMTLAAGSTALAFVAWVIIASIFGRGVI